MQQFKKTSDDKPNRRPSEAERLKLRRQMKRRIEEMKARATAEGGRETELPSQQG